MSPWDAHAADILRAYCALLLAGPRSVVRGADGTRKRQMCAGGGYIEASGEKEGRPCSAGGGTDGGTEGPGASSPLSGWGGAGMAVLSAAASGTGRGGCPGPPGSPGGLGREATLSASRF